MREKHKYTVKVGILGQGAQEINASKTDKVGSLKTLLSTGFDKVKGKERGSSTYREVGMDEKLSDFESIILTPKIDGGSC